MTVPNSTQHWSGTGRLRGGPTGIAFFIKLIRWFGPTVAYGFAIPPALYFSFASPDVPATMDFHRRLMGPLPWWKRRWYVFKHFFAFGRAIIDRTAILAGNTRHFSFDFDGEHHLREAAAQGHGVLLLTAHVGNWEVAGQLLSRIGLPVSVTGFDREMPAIRAMLNRAQAEQKFQLIPLTGTATDAIPLVAALRRGEVVAMLGDRAYGGPTATVPFLGGMASLPVGAYVLAAIANAPAVQVFSLREAGGHYQFYGFPALNPYRPPHHERDAYLKKCAAQFAANLESVVRRDPFQWYNFYPFWDTPPAAPVLAKSSAPASTFPPSVTHPAK
ncbi:MAG: lysophospholipid acyltransferase family protein [Verrucomicrobiae bacterium]|nr:lysophospholipid acyltransferase family protein [Verrucomicrobiae bacterium]